MDTHLLFESGLVKATQSVHLAVLEPGNIGVAAKQLAARAGTSPSATSVALDLLERRGCITRQYPVRGDRRKVHVYLTPYGLKLAQNMREAIQKFAIAAGT